MKDIIAYSNPKNEVVKRYIDLKDSIVSLSDENMKVVMITSTKEHNDLTANLAVVMSKSGYSTLIIDCNIENITLDETFGIERECGLIDYGLKYKSLKDVIKDTEISNLKVITTGKVESNMNMVGNKDMEVLIKEVKGQFDYIIINGINVLNGNESQVLAKYCDGIIVVIEHEKTELAEVKKIQIKLERFKEKILGVVLNNYIEY